MNAFAELLIIIIPPSIVFVVYSITGREPQQPTGTLARSFGAGVLAIIPVVLISLMIPSPISATTPDGVGDLGRMFVLTGLTEETTKLVVLAVFAWPPAWSQRPGHAATVGMFVGFGFGTAETVLASVIGSGSVVMRSLLVSPFHALTTATLAVLYGYRSRVGPEGILGGILFLAIIHTAFNLLLQTGIPGTIGTSILVVVWTTVLVRFCTRVAAV